MRDRQTCIGCGKQSPETETNYTLISAQFGWRLTRYRGPDGTVVVEWRCPQCWRDYKKTRDPSENVRNASPTPNSSLRSRASVAATPAAAPASNSNHAVEEQMPSSSSSPPPPKRRSQPPGRSR